MPQSLGLIVNANARRVRRRLLAGDLFWRDLLPDAMVRITRTLPELRDAVAEFEREGVRVVASLGGDGSLHHLVAAILGHRSEETAPAILPLAGGTLNGLARAYGTAGPPAQVLAAGMALSNDRRMPNRMQHVLKLEATESGDPILGFTFAAGLATRAVAHYYRTETPGVIGAVRASLLPLTSAVRGGRFFAPTGLSVRVEGAQPLDVPHTVVAGVVENALLWFRPFGTSPCDDDRFRIAVASLPPRAIIPRLWSIYRGRCTHPGLYIGTAADATVTGTEGYTVDGELFSSDRFALKLTQGPAVRILDAASLGLSRVLPK